MHHDEVATTDPEGAPSSLMPSSWRLFPRLDSVPNYSHYGLHLKRIINSILSFIKEENRKGHKPSTPEVVGRLIYKYLACTFPTFGISCRKVNSARAASTKNILGSFKSSKYCVWQKIITKLQFQNMHFFFGFLPAYWPTSSVSSKLIQVQSRH